MAKKKLPKVLALLDEDMCTGCEACMTVCPVDCISVIPGPRHENVRSRSAPSTSPAASAARSATRSARGTASR